MSDALNMRAIHVRRYRSLARVSLPDCGQLNVLIGKNNAGKSNVLSTIDLVLEHLKRGAVAATWPAARPKDEFTDRVPSHPAQIGIEFALPAVINAALRERLAKEGPHLEKSIAQIEASPSIVFIVACALVKNRSFMFTEQIGVGTIDATADALGLTGMSLLRVDRAVGRELFEIYDSTQGFQSDVSILRDLPARPEVRFAFERADDEQSRRIYILDQMLRTPVPSQGIRQKVEGVIRAANTQEEFRTGISQLLTELQGRIAKLQKQETEGLIAAFAGDTKTVPVYATWLMQQYGRISVLHLRENKQPIGRGEADALLKLKVRRGGPARLDSIQQTVQALLGVNIDAFEADIGPRGAEGSSAEMDIDEFLVEANGAGIREALRLILDLELQTPALAMIEEPEVHLHPGLERAIETYLREKSREVQMFITTHSTHFVDSASFQNVYLVSRKQDRKTAIEAVGPDDGAFKIPAELGLRLSSLFMFDQLVFVEGPSDEAVLREVARTLGVDLAKANAGFVQMGGIKNFAHFAAEQTMELLSRRRVRLWFLADRDEADDAEVGRMVNMLGDRAIMTILARRELENYLLVPAAVAQFIGEKRSAAGLRDPEAPPADEVTTALQEEARGLKDEVVRLRLERKILRPIYLQHRTATGGPPEERIRRAMADLEGRLTSLEAERAAVTSDLEQTWEGRALEFAPGGQILARAVSRFGVQFRREVGDSAKVARHLSRDDVPHELRSFLENISRGANN